mmetsp:Transcript_52566/g.115294  ORF Transcript_52566/g.115294 Transcript_52566/m.115294 type:complete len:95 (+) Transcript_52566:68-352(+)
MAFRMTRVMRAAASTSAPHWGSSYGAIGLVALFFPVIYRCQKDFYWTRELRSMNQSEIVSDRFQWLHLQMLQDEVEEAVQQSAASCSLRKLGGQ